MGAADRSDVARRGYHHGDLRRALIGAALTAITEDGAANVRPRNVARQPFTWPTEAQLLLHGQSSRSRSPDHRKRAHHDHQLHPHTD